jgi:hypothetical protein
MPGMSERIPSDVKAQCAIRTSNRSIPGPSGSKFALGGHSDTLRPEMPPGQGNPGVELGAIRPRTGQEKATLPLLLGIQCGQAHSMDATGRTSWQWPHQFGYRVHPVRTRTFGAREKSRQFGRRRSRWHRVRRVHRPSTDFSTFFPKGS